MVSAASDVALPLPGQADGGGQSRPRARRQIARVGPVQRWNPWNVVLAVALVASFFTLERLLGVDFTDALVDAPLAGFILWVILEYRRG